MVWVQVRLPLHCCHILAINAQPINALLSAPPLYQWPRCGITGVTILTVQAGYGYCTFQKYGMISLHFLRNDSAGASLLLYISKTSIYFHHFSQN
jgi:hypothetical protein